jgi:hypothetical protein
MFLKRQFFVTQAYKLEGLELRTIFRIMCLFQHSTGQKNVLILWFLYFPENGSPEGRSMEISRSIQKRNNIALSIRKSGNNYYNRHYWIDLLVPAFFISPFFESWFVPTRKTKQNKNSKPQYLGAEFLAPPLCLIMLNLNHPVFHQS